MSEIAEQDEFWEEREEKAGGKIQFQTFATFIGRSGEKRLDLGGLVYIINNIIYFEDFEKESFFIKILGKKRKYSKTDLRFPLDTIQSVKEVSLGEGVNCINGFISEKETKNISPFMKLFSNPILQLSMEGGGACFFDIMKRKEFIEILRS